MIGHQKLLIKLAAYYGYDLTKTQLEVYADQLSRYLSETELNQAMKKYIDDPQNEFFPKPVSKLIALIRKPIDNKDQAQNVVNLIKQAVVNHQSPWVDGYFDGWNQDGTPKKVFYNKNHQEFETWRAAAASEIGELGLTMVEQLGGWKRVCERFNAEPEGVVIGQLVKNAESIMNIAEAGKLGEAPALPSLEKPLLNLVQIKALPGKSGGA